MENTPETSIVLTGFRSGIRLNVAGKVGLGAFGETRAASIGYALETAQSKEGKAFNVVTVISEQSVDDPPDIVLSAYYTQNVAYEEVDLEVRYSDIPTGTMMAVESSMKSLSISRQAISGSSLLGSMATRPGAFSAAFEFKVWGVTAAALRPTSSLTLSFSKIVGAGGGPVKKVLLERIILQLAK